MTMYKPPAQNFVIDDYDLESFARVAVQFGQARFGYVVTPNADHMIRWHNDPFFRTLYLNAAYVLLDSRFISKLCRLTSGQQLPVCTGSDLTARLFSKIIGPDDPVVLVGCAEDQAETLRKRFKLSNLVHYNPPMGFIDDPDAVEAGLSYVEANSPFRFCLLAIGSPQQEIFASLLKQRGRAKGLALCIGASINFLTGEERRAPQWMQNSGTEWLFRLAQAPTRMAERYLIRGPQLFGLLKRTHFDLRSPLDHADAPSRQHARHGKTQLKLSKPRIR